MKNDLIWFAVAFGLMLLIVSIMNSQSIYFYTKDVVIRRFGIFNVELAGSARELRSIIKGIYELSAAESKKAVAALKTYLYIKFLFMPFAYGSVFLLCMLVSKKMQLSAGQEAFVVLARLQIVSWMCDIIENIYLLGKINPANHSHNEATHKKYLIMEAVKWGIVLIASVFSISAVCYFWLSGNYSPASLIYLLIVLAETILFLVLQMFVIQRKKRIKNKIFHSFRY